MSRIVSIHQFAKIFLCPRAHPPVAWEMFSGDEPYAMDAFPWPQPHADVTVASPVAPPLAVRSRLDQGTELWRGCEKYRLLYPR